MERHVFLGTEAKHHLPNKLDFTLRIWGSLLLKPKIKTSAYASLCRIVDPLDPGSGGKLNCSFRDQVVWFLWIQCFNYLTNGQTIPEYVEVPSTAPEHLLSLQNAAVQAIGVVDFLDRILGFRLRIHFLLHFNKWNQRSLEKEVRDIYNYLDVVIFS
jgi:hypothetical protein